MRTYLLKRLLLIPFTLAGIALFSFLLLRYAPGDPAAMMVGSALGGNIRQSELRKEAMDRWRELRGINRSPGDHFLQWGGRMIRLDFGRSYDDFQPVLDKVVERLPATLLLNVVSFALIYSLALAAGIWSATHAGSPADRVLTFLLFLLYSLPSFWVALLLIFWLGDVLPFRGLGSLDADLLPPLAWLADRILHLLLPVFCLTYGHLAALSRYTRSGMLEVLHQDYIRTARAKGLPEHRVILRHAFRNALIPIVTLLADLLPSLISGSVIIEVIFSIDGLGRLTFDAILKRDLPVVMGTVMISAVLTLAGILIADLLYVVVNPTIRLEERRAA